MISIKELEEMLEKNKNPSHKYWIQRWLADKKEQEKVIDKWFYHEHLGLILSTEIDKLKSALGLSEIK